MIGPRIELLITCDGYQTMSRKKLRYSAVYDSRQLNSLLPASQSFEARIREHGMKGIVNIHTA